MPGWLVARALRTPGPAATTAWSLAVLFGASAVMFAVHASLWLVVVLAGAVAAGALPFAVLRVPRRDPWLRWWALAAVVAAGVAFGIAMWFLTPTLSGGDDLFHLARVRKLLEFGDLSLSSVNEFEDGGLHPGYAFPLWHVLLALAGLLGGVDAGAVVLHEASILVPLALALAWEAGAAVFRSAWLGIGTAAAQAGIVALAAGSAGAYTALALPATASRQLLVLAVIALFFAAVVRTSWTAVAAVAAATVALALVHPTYAVFVAIPLGGFVAARALLARRDFVFGPAALAAVVLPTVAVALWLRPIARETASVDPTDEELARALRHYEGQIDVLSDDRYRIAPELFGRSGAIAVLALASVPLAVLAAKRRWAAFVLGGFVLLMAVLVVPDLFMRFSDVVSLSQSRRAAGFVPFAIAVVGAAAVATRVLSYGALPLALGVGIAFQLAYPGDFGYSLDEGGPAAIAWIALAGGAAALVAGVLLPRRFAQLDSRGPLACAAALLAVVPVAVHGFTHWEKRETSGLQLTPGLIAAIDRRVPVGDVVFSDVETSYRIAAFAPVYVANGPPGHVADTKKNRPYERRDDEREFFHTGDLAILRRYGADWLVMNVARHKLQLDLRAAYRDDRFALYPLARAP